MAKGVMRSNKSRDGIAAMLAYNIGDLEDDVYNVRQEWDAQHVAFQNMQDTLEQAGLRVLNKPNLIKQNWWTTGMGVEHPVVYGRDARISGPTYPYLTSYNFPTETTQTTEPTAEQKAAATSIYSMEEEGVTTYHIFTDDDDFQATVADLAAADQIEETDGETYAKAIQFDITANAAYGNMEWLLYCNPYSSRTYPEGAANVRNWGQIEEMEPGQTYSVSCWVRVLSGDGVWMRMGYGNSYSNPPRADETNHRSGISDWIEVQPLGGAWQRISWTFDFNPSGDWYTETSATEGGVTTVTRTYNWYKKIGFGIGRKYTATVQMCGFRLVRGKTYICETYDDLEQDLTGTKARVTALEAGKSALLAIMAESDDETAAAPHAVGDLFTMGDALYKCTDAIATGETITPGSNCTSTTLAAEIAASGGGGGFTPQTVVPENVTASGTQYTFEGLVQGTAYVVQTTNTTDNVTLTISYHTEDEQSVMDQRNILTLKNLRAGDVFFVRTSGSIFGPKVLTTIINAKIEGISAGDFANTSFVSLEPADFAYRYGLDKADYNNPRVTGTVQLGSTTLTETQLQQLLALIS